jgi:arsenite methyltransferase
LVPNKQRAYNECFRVLKPGGQLAISDIAFKKALPEPFASNVKYWTGCIAGAQAIDEMREQLKIAGFTQIDVIDSQFDLNVYKSAGGGASSCCSDTGISFPLLRPYFSSCSLAPSCCSGPASACAVDLPGAENIDLNEFAMSVKVFAVKPK